MRTRLVDVCVRKSSIRSAIHRPRSVALMPILIVFSLLLRGQAQQAAPQSVAGNTVVPTVAAAKAPTTFFFVHWQYFSLKESKNTAMQRIVDEFQESLRSRGVRFVSDPLRKTSHSKEPLPLATLLRIAKDVEASHLLYLNMAVSGQLQCFDLSGRLVWEEKGKRAIAAGALEHNVRVVTKRLEKQLEPRIGTECLEVAGPSDPVRALPETTAQR